MSIQIPSDQQIERVHLPRPSAVIGRLPVVIRDRIDAAQLPALHEKCCVMIAECVKAAAIEEGLYYADASEAIAVLAKKYKDDRLALGARQLKLQAFRRMGQIAERLAAERAAAELSIARAEAARKAEEASARASQLREQGEPYNAPEIRRLQGLASRLKTGRQKAVGGHGTGVPKIGVELRAAGLSSSQASHASRLSRVLEPRFQEMVARGQGVNTASHAARGTAPGGARAKSDSHYWLNIDALGPRLVNAANKLRSRPAREVAAGIAPGEVKRARELAIELTEWLDTFEQALPK